MEFHGRGAGLRWGAVGLLTLLVVAACGGEGEAGAVQAVRDEFQGDRSTGRLPLDVYAPDQVSQLTRWNYAENLLVADCLEDKGLPGYPPDVGGPPEGASSGGWRLFDVDVASEHGYVPPGIDDGGDSGLTEAQRAARDDFDARLASTPGGGEMLDECRQVATEDRSDGAVEFANFVSNLRGSAADVARADGEVQAAMDRWRGCMEPLGVADLPDLPEQMPSEGVRQQLDIPAPRADDGSGDWFAGRPTVEEIDFAVHDAECRESSGYAEAFYDAQVEAQFDEIADNLERLEDGQAVYEEAVAWADEIIANRG